MKSTRKVSARRKAVRPAPALSLSARVERLEKELLFPAQAKLAPSSRFVNLGPDGRPTTGKHVAVYDHQTGLTWAAEPLGGDKGLQHAAAMKACSELDLLGHKDWRAPTIQELLSIVDYSRYDPAVDTSHFLGPHGWTWSSTIAAAPSGFAWRVGLFDGHSYRYHQVLLNHVRAVRAGQF